ncbi:MAG: hypothetical protein P8L18_02580 [Verrucomicrobiota bacterium]|nr:hypothetical protein [Verrucomicrobiota bacterium]
MTHFTRWDRLENKDQKYFQKAANRIMKIQLNLVTVFLALFGVFTKQTSTAQSPIPHPAYEALKGLQPFIGNWAGEFEAEGVFEGLEKGRMISATRRVKWILHKTAVQLTWDAKYKDDGKPHYFGKGTITLDPLSKKLHWNSIGYDGNVYWTGKGVVELRDKVLHFDLDENTINKTNNKLQTTMRKPDRKTLLTQHKNLVINGKKIGDLKEIKMTRVPSRKSGKRTNYKNVPWDWLLGHWSIDNSDGTKTKVHWWQPDPESDYLIGKWEHEDGTWQMEIVGWREDTQTLSALHHGSNGLYVESSFTEFLGRRKMKGSFRRREGSGKIVRGSIEIHRVRDDLVHTRLVHSDGTIVTEKMTQVSAQ